MELNSKDEQNVDMAGIYYIGRVCKYRCSEPHEPFIVTRVYAEEDGNNKKQIFFDAIRADGSVIEDGTLSLICRVHEDPKRYSSFRKLFAVIWEEIERCETTKSIPVRRRSRRRCSGGLRSHMGSTRS